MKKRHVVILSVLIIIVVAIIAGLVIKSGINANLEKLVGLPISDVNLAKIEDGVYTGSYSTFPVAAEVKVTVKDHRITGIELIKHNNGKGKAAEAIPEKVVETQKLDLDIVSGATYSSKVILKAIENALNSAGK